MSSKEATKGGSSKAPTDSKTSHSKKIKESNLAMDSNPSQTLVSTPIDTEMHKEDQQATASFTIHFESASGNDALAVSIAEADPGILAPSDFIPQQQGINEGTKNNSYAYLFIGKWASLIARQIEEETSSTIKLEDLAKLVSHVQPSFKDLDSPKDNPIITVDDSDEDEENKVHATENVETKDSLVSKSLSSSSLPTELKDLPSKFNELTEEVKGLNLQVHELETKLPGDLKEFPYKMEEFTKTITSLLLSVTNALNMFAQVLDSDSSKDRDQSVPSKIEEEAKAEAARREREIRKEELIDLLGHEVNNTTTKLPILKLGEYEMWVIKDYALWEVIENASTISPNVNTASPQVSTAKVNYNDVYAFMVENPNGSNLLQQDLEQIHEDDLEAMDLRAQRNQYGRFRNQDNTRKQGNSKDTSSKAILAIDGVGFDWSDVAEEQV
nr:hypothetical protein [Tanacetum cinerariifolium]